MRPEAGSAAGQTAGADEPGLKKGMRSAAAPLKLRVTGSDGVQAPVCERQ